MLYKLLSCIIVFSLGFCANEVVAQTNRSAKINSSQEEAEKLLAIQVAAKRMLDYIDGFANSEEEERVLIVEKLTTEIRKNISDHKNEKISKKKCRDIVSKWRRSTFNDKLTKEVVRLQELSALPIKKSDVLSRMGNDWESRLSSSIKSFVDNQYSELYNSARYRVIILQRDEMEKSIPYPSLKNLNKRLEALSNDIETDLTLSDFDSLTKWIKSFNAKFKKEVVDEVKFYSDYISVKRLFEIKNQYERQLEILKRKGDPAEIPAMFITSKLIETYIKDSLKAHIKSEKDKIEKSGSQIAKIPVYKIFSIVEAKINKLSIDLEKQKILEYLKQQVAVQVREDDLEEKIFRDLPEHKLYEASLENLIYDYYTTISPDISSKYAQLANVSSTELSAKNFDYINSIFINNDFAVDVLIEKIGDEIVKQLPAVRGGIADEQLAKFFPNYNQPLSYDDIEKFYHSRVYNNRLINLNDIEKILKPTNKNYSSDILLQEAEGKLISEINFLMKAGFNSLGYQLELVKRYEHKNYNELKRAVKGGINADELYSDWRNSIAKLWRKRAEESKVPYTKLFNETDLEINKSVRALFDAFQIDYVEPYVKWRWDMIRRDKKMKAKFNEMDRRKIN